MNHEFNGWDKVAAKLRTLADDRDIQLNDGQAASLRELAKRLPANGVIIADEVGMGKTRIAVAVARAVIAEGGRVAILVPPGLGYQWSDELRNAGVSAPPILRSLRQYLSAWDSEQVKRKPPWSDQQVVLISHAFTNWRLGKNSDNWRWTLLPEMYAQWHKLSRNHHTRNKLNDDWVQHAAKSVIEAIRSRNDPQWLNLIEEMAKETPWPSALDAAEYGRNEVLRPWLERAVGLGLGVFDLVIVDEAHKSRGQDSGLNRLLNGVVLQSSDSRCLAMTATPVELDATQWTQMLGRIQVDEISQAAATTAISNYAQAVARVRQCPSDNESREKYKESAKNFKQALDPYLLRRDKREDPAVIQFQKKSGEGYHAYRREQEILIDTARLAPAWKQAVCAAEALSFVARQSDGEAAGKLKRQRLTLGNGHGIATCIDHSQIDDVADQKQIETDGFPDALVQGNAEVDVAADKRLLRAQWWRNIMAQPFLSSGSPLFDHPAILAAVQEIENVCKQDEKVLVFGRFTRPLRALVQLLNAREMLRSLDGGRPWPPSKVHEDSKTGVSEWSAVIAAHRQLGRSCVLDRESLNRILEKQYEGIEKQRSKFRENLIANIENGLSIEEGRTGQPIIDRVRALFESFRRKSAMHSGSSQANDGADALVLLARAMQEMLGEHIEVDAQSDFGKTFIELVKAASDRDEGDSDGDAQVGEEEASALWSDLRDRLKEEYNRPEGGFARLMYGETKPATRRLLQLAFNRKHGHPRVLVAQSLVGREGLNLHKACRTVVLLHPEWNPGVVEQQIGRVDRIGSLWEEKLNQAIADQHTADDLPRIEIRPVIFQGTYDEENWRVLNNRWDDLRAQLHGIVISPRIAEKYSDSLEMVAEINEAAPNFSPPD